MKKTIRIFATLTMILAMVAMSLPVLGEDTNSMTAQFLLSTNGRVCGLLDSEWVSETEPIDATEISGKISLADQAGRVIRVAKTHNLTEGVGLSNITVKAITVLDDEYIGLSADDIVEATIVWLRDVNDDATIGGYHRIARNGETVARLAVSGGTIDIVRATWDGEKELCLLPGYVEPDKEPVTTPTPTEKPTQEPTVKPTEKPTQEPTTAPTEAPTQEPTQEPTVPPTEAPTHEPTHEPTVPPTEAPTPVPTPAPKEDDVPPKQKEDLEDWVQGEGTPAPMPGATPAPVEDPVPPQQEEDLMSWAEQTPRPTEVPEVPPVATDVPASATTPAPVEDELPQGQLDDLNNWL